MHIISTRSSATGCCIAQQLNAESAPRHPARITLRPRVSLGSKGRMSSHASYRGSLLIQGTMRFKSAKPAPTKKTGASPRLALLPAGVNIPLAEKAATGGEDALMMCPNPSGGGSVAVADGVGSWNDKGVNPGAYSRALMHFSREMFQAELAEAERPAGLLQRVQALLRLRKECTPKSVIANAISKAKVPGSATIAMASLNADQGLLETAYIGDAGVMVVRGEEVLFKSDQQQYEFDMPYQVACRAFVDMDYNSANDAQVEQIEVQRGDIIILASDGLFDNLFDSEILQIKSEVLATDNIRTGNAYTRAEALASDRSMLKAKSTDGSDLF
ncbi:hypothetical protein CYMTET_18157 [Cymbomonas tetramitiformis]|uniref:Protein phosphatase n=1 Tax=Cymbomonas tetramitiformis TaxID=36881 RepID=A0AAE0G900_9CHLO|nr:hypothetical protein CYMTET_18157 [Cymbomonas tetramitiformis]